MNFTEWVSEYVTVRGKKIALNESQMKMLEYFKEHNDALLVYKPRSLGPTTVTRTHNGISYETLNEAYKEASLGKEAPDLAVYYGTEEEFFEKLDEITSGKTPEGPVSETTSPSHGEAMGESTGTVK